MSVDSESLLGIKSAVLKAAIAGTLLGVLWRREFTLTEALSSAAAGLGSAILPMRRRGFSTRTPRRHHFQLRHRRHPLGNYATILATGIGASGTGFKSFSGGWVDLDDSSTMILRCPQIAGTAGVVA